MNRQENINKKMWKVELVEKERNLIELIRDIGFGEIKITIQDSLPIRVEMIKKSIKL